MNLQEKLRQIKSISKNAEQRYTILLLLSSLILTTIGDFNSGLIVGVLALALSTNLLDSKSIELMVDLHILIPLGILYIVGMISLLYNVNEVIFGFTTDWLLLPVVYILVCSLGSNDMKRIKFFAILWVELITLFGLVQYVLAYLVNHEGGRFGGVFGNANAMGILLVFEWFLLKSKDLEDLGYKFHIAEPLILVCLAMTLSMGSFVSFGVALLIFCKKSNKDIRSVLLYFCNTVCKLLSPLLVGLLFYTSTRPNMSDWAIILPLVAFIGLLLIWNQINNIIYVTSLKYAPLVLLVGVCATALFIWFRPSATATFTERIDMMASGFKYLFKNPLLGIGQFNWRSLDLSDGGTYYNTWYIHNVFLHLAVESGLLCLLSLVWVIVRFFKVQWNNYKGVAEMCAVCTLVIHSFVDVALFRICIPCLILITCSNACARKAKLIKIERSLIAFVTMGMSFLYLFSLTRR